jgi:C_GCAxxG_C_C family probable redox protein
MMQMSKPLEAVKLFNSGYNCAQAVLAAFCEPLGLDRVTAYKLASGFGGGLGAKGEICGALSGAIMALGLKFGCSDPDKTAKAETYRKTRELAEEFKLRTGSLYCRDLLGFDLGTPEGQSLAKKPGSFDKCDDFVKIAAEILQEMFDAHDKV